MAEKKYYWLKMTDQFFKDKTIKKLRKIAGGDTYTIIYLKMLLTAIKQGNKMYFEGIEDDFMEELALELDEDTDNVKVTVSYLKSKGLIEVLGADEILLTQCAEMVGSETDAARRKRLQRDRDRTRAIGTDPLQKKNRPRKKPRIRSSYFIVGLKITISQNLFEKRWKFGSGTRWSERNHTRSRE